MKRILCLLVAIIAYILPINAIDGNNYILNTNKSAYNNGSQIWQISEYSNGWMYFANNNGLVQHNGSSWSSYSFGIRHASHAVMASKTRKCIFVGGINEFGYFKTRANGDLVYRSISNKTKDSEIGNVWNIWDDGNILYFQGDNLIYEYINGKHKVIDPNCKINTSALINGALYLGTGEGMKLLVGNRVMRLPKSDIVKNKIIRAILPYHTGIIIVTSVGLYFFDGNEVRPMVTGQESFMAKYEIFCADIKGEKIALGTIRGGVMMIDLRDLSVKTFNERNGLQDNTVLSIKFDSAGNLWTGLTSGIDCIALVSAFTKLNLSDTSIGSGYTVAQNGDMLYLGTNRGLYTVKVSLSSGIATSPFTQVKGLGGQVWGLQRIGDDIFCLHDKGLFLLQGETPTRISNIVGFWKCQLAKGTKNIIYAGTYNGIYTFVKNKGHWQLLHKINGINYNCRRFEQENARTIWLGDGINLIRIKLNATLDRALSKKVYSINSDMDNSKICNIKNHIFFINPNGIFTYDAKTDKIVAYKRNDLIDNTLNYMCVKQMGDIIAALGPRGIYLNNMKTHHHQYLFIDIPNMEFEEDCEDIFPLSKTLMILPNSEGFSIIDLHNKQTNISTKNLLKIREVYSTAPYDSLVYTENFLERKTIPEIKYKNNSIRINYRPYYANNTDALSYQYKLNNEKWSGNTQLTSKEYSKLHEGTYTFCVRTKSADGRIFEDCFTFKILPPWYRTVWAYIIYILILTGIAVKLLHLENSRIERKKKEALADKNREMEKMQENYALEKKELEESHRHQQMTDMMINVSRKNEILNAIKAELTKTSATLNNGKIKEVQQKLLSIRSRIDDNIDGDTVFNRIEEQFDMANSGFMKRLREKHPDLNGTERMICGYLYTNLSSKEIAPLLNISVRGVETIRYRLRKKFNLEREDSLTEYIMKI